MTPALKSVAVLAASAALLLGSMVLTRAARPAPTEPAPGPTTTATPVSVNRFLHAIPESTHTLRGASDMHVEINVQAPAGTETVRPPLSVAIVIDRSGSMEGAKLVQAKRAAIELISNLEERDRFSVTTYGSDVETILPLRSANRSSLDRAIHIINSIRVNGDTYLSGGLVAARDQLKGRDDGVRRIVLISDGLANRGIKLGSELANLARDTAGTGITTTTVGVGLDFDEKTMTAIAVAGRGNYYYAEKAIDMFAMFRTELGRVSATTGTDIRLQLRVEPGVEIIEAYGHRVRDNTVWLADLHAGETRRVVFHIRTRFKKTGTMPLGEVRLRMTEVGTGKSVTESQVLSVESTDDFHAVTRGASAQAVKQVELARTAITIERATSLYESGDTLGANRALEARRAQAMKRGAEIGVPSLGRDISAATTEAAKNLEPAASSDAGKSATKRNRKATYDMLY